MIYLDTSALLKLYLREKGSEEVHEIVISQDLPLPVWELQEMELINALHLKVFWKELSQKDCNAQLAHFDSRKARGLYFFPEIRRPQLQKDFRDLAIKTPKIGCRTLDIMHVACALQLEITRFVTFDDRQRKLAKLAGLPLT
jgi:predicted nucleic acid-binding protein